MNQKSNELFGLPNLEFYIGYFFGERFKKKRQAHFAMVVAKGLLRKMDLNSLAKELSVTVEVDCKINLFNKGNFILNSQTIKKTLEAYGNEEVDPFGKKNFPSNFKADENLCLSLYGRCYGHIIFFYRGGHCHAGYTLHNGRCGDQRTCSNYENI